MEQFIIILGLAAWAPSADCNESIETIGCTMQTDGDAPDPLPVRVSQRYVYHNMGCSVYCMEGVVRVT